MKNIKIFSEKGIRVNKGIIDHLITRLKASLKFEISSLEINFVGYDTITEINLKHLEHLGSTDIITFNYSEESNRFDAEIFISIYDAEENANKYGVTLDNELGRLIIHGLLHLLGYDDVTLSKKRRMKKLENELLARYYRFTKGILVK
jgi:probable rRNA maturation factor